MKIKKKFDFKGLDIRIVEVDVEYPNSSKIVTVKRVIAPNGGIIPVKIQHKQTLKSIALDTIETLNCFANLGADVVHELTKES